MIYIQGSAGELGFTLDHHPGTVGSMKRAGPMVGFQSRGPLPSTRPQPVRPSAARLGCCLKTRLHPFLVHRHPKEGVA